MEVLHISHADGGGGASRAAQRIHANLGRVGVRSEMAVGSLSVGGPRIDSLRAAAARGRLGKLLAVERVFPKLRRFTGEVPFPVPSSHLLARSELFRAADVIHLHNLHGGYFDLRALPGWRRKRPLVWTLHDMWPLTGHCAYSYGCPRWRTGCGNCPLFEPQRRPLDEISQPPWDNSRSGWRRKRTLYQDAALAVVSPSRWLLDLASSSILATDPRTMFHHVPYGLDTDLYRPRSKGEVRRVLGLRADSEVVMVSAASLGQERKGIRHLVRALQTPPLADRDIELLALGEFPRSWPKLDRVRALGPLMDDRLMAAAYAAADVAVVPSLADNQPLVALEAMACGTPVVASDVGGVLEIVREFETGRRVPPADPQALGRAIASLLEDRALRERLGDAARKLVVANHGLLDHVTAYRTVYETAIARDRH